MSDQTSPAPGRIEPLPPGMDIVPPNRVRDIALTVPVCPPAADEYVPLKLEARLTERQARGLAAVRTALDRQTATTDNGSRVVHNPDAIRWLLERVADATGELTPPADQAAT